jgi:hypothetical protein
MAERKMTFAKRVTSAVTLVAVLASGEAGAATITSSSPTGVVDGRTSEWAGRAPDLKLEPKGKGAREGSVWIAQSPQGVIVAGEVLGPLASFARDAVGMPNGDHVEVWVSLVDSIPWPPVGWGHQFGPVLLENADACEKPDTDGNDPPFGAGAADVAECRRWYSQQASYRRKLERLFTRQWQIAPGVAVETFATPALEAMINEEKAEAQALVPSVLPQAHFDVGRPGGYGFEILVPWSALPPADQLALDRLNIMIDVFSPGRDGKYGPFATTAPSRAWGQPRTFNTLALVPPRTYRLGACGLPLEADDTYEPVKLPGFFLPGDGVELDTFFTLENVAAGYQYRPENPSPGIVLNRVFSRSLTSNMTVCGPTLAVRRGNGTLIQHDMQVSANLRATKADGGWLLANGPNEGMFNRFGTGVCGACPTIELSVMFIPDEAKPAVMAFAGSWLIEDPDLDSGGRNARVRVAEDQRTIEVWEAAPVRDAKSGDLLDAAWTYSRHCYQPSRNEFQPCGREEGRPPPNDLDVPAGSAVR